MNSPIDSLEHIQIQSTGAIVLKFNYKYKNAYFFILVLFNPNTGNVMICDQRDVM